MDTPTEADFTRLTEAHAETETFKTFVLDRFKTFALAHLRDHGNPLDVDAIIKQGGGYVTFRVDEHSLFNTAADDIRIISSTADDRGGRSTDTVYALPKAFLFKTSKQEADFAKYLALRAKLFPTAV